MKIAVSAVGPSLDAQVDPRFGRCGYFVIVDPETMAFEAVENSSTAAAQGAGIATAQMIAGKGVEAVLTGNCGPNAHQVLVAAGIRVVTGVTGTVRDAAKGYSAGRFEPARQPSVASHHGMGVGSPAPQAAAAGPDVAELLLDLKNQIGALREQMSDISRRVDELDGEQ